MVLNLPKLVSYDSDETKAVVITRNGLNLGFGSRIVPRGSARMERRVSQ